jgi:atypical dual specificity phosphatase
MGTYLNALNFSWIIDKHLAGHRAPLSGYDLAWLKAQGVLALVRMAEKRMAAVSSQEIEELGLWDCHQPVDDFAAPAGPQLEAMIQFINRAIAVGRPVGVSCGAGLGRTGTIWPATW